MIHSGTGSSRGVQKYVCNENTFQISAPFAGSSNAIQLTNVSVLDIKASYYLIKKYLELRESIRILLF
jgi:hypothetical protein